MLSLTDTGSGIDDSVKDHLFEPFFTTKEAGQGSGLGLATCFGIVTQMKGHIWAESVRGKGCTFSVLLPQSSRSEHADHKLSSDAKSLPGGHETILLVEDDNALRSLIQRTLERCGYVTLTAENGAAGIEIGRQHGRSIDLLLSDVVMPSLNGVDLAGLLRADNPDLKVVLMSGYTGETRLDTLQEDERFHFLQKPFTPSTLARVLRELLDA
jgi:CheY-like chemotaxis protein